MILLSFSPAQAAPKSAGTGTICTITLNSSDEKEVFKQQLKGFQFKELVPDQKEDSKDASSDPRSWFQKSCEAFEAENVQCDALVISGHFGGTFFGSSGKNLSLEDLEDASCNHRCDGVLKDPKAVYLFGCNTLAGKDQDSRTPEQYRQVLIGDGIPAQQAEQIVEERYGATGSTNRDRMVRVFGNTPRIYGFSSIGPKGEHVKDMLTKFFKEEPDYSAYLKKAEAERLAKDKAPVLSQFNKFNNHFNDPFQKCLNETAVTCANGVCEQKKDVTEQLCSVRNENIPLSDRLTTLDGLLRQKDALAFVPTAASVLANIDPSKLSDAEKKAFDQLKNNPSLKDSLLTLIQNEKATLYSQKVKWIALASKLEWLSPAEQKKAYQNVGEGLIKGINDQSNWDLFFSIYHQNKDFSLALKDDPKVANSLVEALKNQDARVRSNAAYELGEIKPSDPKIANLLADALKDQSADVRLRAAYALGEIKPSDPKVANSLVDALKDQDADVRLRAADALGAIKPSDPKIANSLADALKDQDAGLRWHAANALGAIKPSDPKIANSLVEALKDQTAMVRLGAANALGAIKTIDPKVLNSVVDLLKNQHKGVRESAAFAIGYIKPSDPKTVNSLVEALKDQDAQVRSGAAFALGEIKPSNPKVANSLVEALKDQDAQVRSGAAFTLGEIKPSDPKVANSLVEALKDQDAQVSSSAAYALREIKPSDPAIKDAMKKAGIAVDW